MAIELSTIIFTDQDDIVPQSGEDEVVNSGIANTLAGNDIITGTGNVGIENVGVLNTEDGNDTITGTALTYGIYTRYNSTFDTGKGNDVITGISKFSGFLNVGTFSTGEGDDIITGTGGKGIESAAAINTDDGNDTITGTGIFYGILMDGFDSPLDTGKGDDIITGTGGNAGIQNNFGNTLNTDDGNDIITGIGDERGISNNGTINTGNGEDSIISQGNFVNYYNEFIENSGVFLGDGNDSITVINTDNTGFPSRVFENFGMIDAGDGNDLITSTGVIYNEGVINTGNGDDSIIVDEGVDGSTTGYGIYNNGGAINMGDGNDSIIANEGFESGLNSSGAWFLGEDDDYLKGFGNGDFYGGNGNDTLELTSGTYTIRIWGEGGESPIFTKGNQLMITSEFEKLIAGGTIYDFTSLTAGQIIVVA
jgi:hypothetical protein